MSDSHPLFQSELFQTWLVHTDQYAEQCGLDVWATRLVLIAIDYDHQTAKAFAEDSGLCARGACRNPPAPRKGRGPGSKYCSRNCSNRIADRQYKLRKRGGVSLHAPGACYDRLVEVGLFCEDPWGVAWIGNTEPWESDPILWLHELIRIADGQEPPAEFPLFRGDAGGHPHLRLVG